MLKGLIKNAVKVLFFAVSFVAYWYSLDEKYYRYREQKLAAGNDER